MTKCVKVVHAQGAGSLLLGSTYASCLLLKDDAHCYGKEMIFHVAIVQILSLCMCTARVIHAAERQLLAQLSIVTGHL